MKLYEDEFITLSIDESVPCLEWIGKKFMSSEEFRLSEEKSFQFYKQFKGKHSRLEWFVDARNIGPIATEDTQWVAEKILPQFAAAGLKKEGFVVPTSAIGKMVVRNYMSNAGKVIEIQVFGTVEEAKNWLHGKK
jgi:hypothetical protein